MGLLAGGLAGKLPLCGRGAPGSVSDGAPASSWDQGPSELASGQDCSNRAGLERASLQPPCHPALASVLMLMHSSPRIGKAIELQCFVCVQPIGDAAQELAAEYICIAHDIMSRSSHAVFVTHNDFQGTSDNDTTGLIPVWTGTPSCLPQMLPKSTPPLCSVHALQFPPRQTPDHERKWS